MGIGALKHRFAGYYEDWNKMMNPFEEDKTMFANPMEMLNRMSGFNDRKYRYKDSVWWKPERYSP